MKSMCESERGTRRGMYECGEFKKRQAHRRKAECTGQCRLCAAANCEQMSNREREQRMREKREKL